VTCAEFDAEADELAVGALPEPRRSALLAHAAECASCAARLRALTDVADRLLLLAPSVEPPAGFESRVLARIGGSWTRHLPRALTAAAVVLALVAGVVLGRAGGDDGLRKASIVAASTGDAVGKVALVDEPHPHVLISLYEPRAGGGARSCELVLADGRRVDVGSWTYDEIKGGVWAAGIDDELLDAVSMRILDGDRVIARARFD
jgi:hypothetical protein